MKSVTENRFPHSDFFKIRAFFQQSDWLKMNQSGSRKYIPHLVRFFSLSRNIYALAYILVIFQKIFASENCQKRQNMSIFVLEVRSEGDQLSYFNTKCRFVLPFFKPKMNKIGVQENSKPSKYVKNPQNMGFFSSRTQFLRGSSLIF